MKTIKQVPEFGKGVYQITTGPKAHVHRYHKYCPFNSDETKLVFLEYKADEIEARVCVMDVESGAVETIGTSTAWGTHSGANQFWTDDRVIFSEAIADDGTVEREQLAYVSWTGLSQLYMIDMEEALLTQ